MFSTWVLRFDHPCSQRCARCLFYGPARVISEANAARLRTLVRASARRSKIVVTVSEFSRSRLIHHFDIDPGRIHVTPLAVDARWHRIEDQSRPQSLAAVRLPEKYVLAVGNLHPRKNVPRLVRAVAAAPKSWCRRHPLGAGRAEGLALHRSRR